MNDSKALARVKPDNTLLVITGGQQFTDAEAEQIRKRMTKEATHYLEYAGKEILVMEAAEEDLRQRVRRLERKLRETQEYQNLVLAKKELRIVRARRGETRTKVFGVLESILTSIRPGTGLYKKLFMLRGNEEA